MDKQDNELIKKVFLAQRESPNQGDFVTLVNKDFKDFNMTHEEITSKGIKNTQL